MNKSPAIGSLVTVNSSYQYQEWCDGTVYRVVGLTLRSNTPDDVDIAIARPENDTGRGWRGWEEHTDGFNCEDLDEYTEPSESCTPESEA